MTKSENKSFGNLVSEIYLIEIFKSLNCYYILFNDVERVWHFTIRKFEDSVWTGFVPIVLDHSALSA